MLNDSPVKEPIGEERDRMLSVDGQNIHVVENGSPSGPTLLLIHGYAGSTSWWDLLVPRLAVDYRVIRVDLLGHGRSDKPADGYAISAQGRLVGSVLITLGVNQVTVVGHSTGGLVATSLAEQRRDLVRGLALIDTGPSVDAFLRPGGLGALVSVPVIGQLLWALRTESTIRKGLSSAFSREVDVSTRIVADVRGMDHRAFTTTPKQAMSYLAQRSLPDRLCELRLPVLVIFGVEDRRWRSSSTTEYADVPNVTVELLPGVGHSPLLEEPDRTLELLTTFIARNDSEAPHGRG